MAFNRTTDLAEGWQGAEFRKRAAGIVIALLLEALLIIAILRLNLLFE